MDRGVVLVTGGSRGIGAAVARAAAAAGWAVCLTYRADEAAAASVVAEIEAAGGSARAVRADNAVEADVLAAFAAADAMGPLTALVANAGIVGTKARVDEMTVERSSGRWRSTCSARSSAVARPCDGCRRGTAAAAARSCSSPRRQAGSAAPASTSTTPRRREPSTRSPSGSPGRWPTRESG